MGGKKHRWPIFLLGLLALAAWTGGLFLAQRAGDYAAAVAVRWTGEGPSPAQVLQAERWAAEDGARAGDTLTLWKEDAGQSLSGGDDSGATVRVLSCYGEAETLWPAAFLAGGYPARGDGGGCALDEAAAFALWGSADAVGRAVRWEGRTYAVRGVFRGTEGVMLVQDSGESAAAYEHGLLRLESGGGQDDARLALEKMGLGGGALLDLPLLAWCLNALAALPGLVLALALLLRLLGRGWRLRYSPLLLSCYLPPALAWGALTLWCAGFPWALPDQLIPSQWSDFDFWPKVGGEIAGAVKEIFSAALTARDLALWPLFPLCLAAAMAACALVVLWCERTRTDSLRALLTDGLGAMGAVFVLLLALADAGGVTAGRALWGLPMLWLGADWLLRLHEAAVWGGASGMPCPVVRGGLGESWKERGEDHALEAPGEEEQTRLPG